MTTITRHQAEQTSYVTADLSAQQLIEQSMRLTVQIRDSVNLEAALRRVEESALYAPVHEAARVLIDYTHELRGSLRGMRTGIGAEIEARDALRRGLEEWAR